MSDAGRWYDVKWWYCRDKSVTEGSKMVIAYDAQDAAFQVKCSVCVPSDTKLVISDVVPHGSQNAERPK